jgi:TRAP-type uncharacterized transport system fused permease subunit
LFQGSFGNIIIVSLTALAGVWALSGCVGGYLIRPVGGIGRAALGAAGLLLFYAGTIEDVIGFAILGVVFLVQIRGKGSENRG